MILCWGGALRMSDLITGVYLFKDLPNDLKKDRGIKLNPSNPRLDFVGSFDSGYGFTDPLMNTKGYCYVSILEPYGIIDARAKRTAQKFISNSLVGNLSSLYGDWTNGNTRFWGCTNPNLKIRKGTKLNPMIEFKNDLLLFEVSEDFSSLLVLVLEGKKNEHQFIYPKFLEGEFDSLIDEKLNFLDSGDLDHTL